MRLEGGGAGGGEGLSCSEAKHGLASLAASYLIIIMRKRVIVRVIGHDTISWGGKFLLVSPQSSVQGCTTR